MDEPAAPDRATPALGHTHLLSADQFATRGTSPVAPFTQGLSDDRARPPDTGAVPQ